MQSFKNHHEHITTVGKPSTAIGRSPFGVRHLSVRAKLRTMRVLVLLGASMLVFAPSQAFAHDNLGGDELAATGWMLIGAFVVLLLGIFAGIWAFKSGQFSNVEEAANRMVENSEDYDAVMAAAAERERAAMAVEQEARERQQSEQAAAVKQAPSDRPAPAKL